MVMQEAIKDKTLQVQKQMVNEQTGEVIGHQQQELDGEEEGKDSDSDFDLDEEDDAYMRQVRD